MIRPETIERYTGRKYGRITILDVTGRDPKNRHHYFVRCRCECGTVKATRLSCLQQGTTRSCGCFSRERMRAANVGHTRTRKTFGESSFNNLMRHYERGAKDRGLCFDLTEADFREITSGRCFYCGCEPRRRSRLKNGHGHYDYNGVDRIDNAIGYTRDNCVPACRPCNTAKNAISKDAIYKLYHRLFPLQS